jgi:transcriptional regulator with XRE-family HTH domain
MHHQITTLTGMPDPEAVAAAVARNARMLRSGRGWSLDALAQRAGISKGMLVQIEAARTNPSLGTLCRLSEAFGVTLAQLVELGESPSVRVVAPDDVVRFWDSGAGSYGDLLVGSDRREHIELWRWALAPGESHGAEAHADGTRELLHVLDGTLTLEVEHAVHRVPPGGAALFAADREHRYVNDGTEPTTFVMVVVQPTADLDDWVVARTVGAEAGEALPPA